jgi:hypothetical protein
VVINFLQAGQFRNSILVGAGFSAPVQTGPGVHPASYMLCIRSFQEVKLLDCGIDYPPPVVLSLKKEQSFASTLLAVLSWQIIE